METIFTLYERLTYVEGRFSVARGLLVVLGTLLAGAALGGLVVVAVYPALPLMDVTLQLTIGYAAGLVAGLPGVFGISLFIANVFLQRR